MELRIYTDSQSQQPFTQWLNELKDVRARAQIRARLTRIEAGNFGDFKSLREGVQELKIDYGPG